MLNTKIISALISSYANIPRDDVLDSETLENHGITLNDFYEMIAFLEEHFNISLLNDVSLEMTVRELREIVKLKS